MTINYSKQVLLKRGNTAVSSTYVGPLGEVTYDTGLHQIRVHDGERAGGWIVPGGPEYDLLLPLIGNAATQQTQINSLFANAAVQQTLIANLVNQGNADPGTDNETFWFNTEDGRLYIKWEDMWVDSSPTILPSPGYITGIMEDFAGNIIPAANVTYSLGTQQAQWKDLWVSSNTIYIGNTPITVSNGSLSVGGNVVSGGGGTADLGKFKIDAGGGYAYLTTTDDADGNGGYNITINPNGEGSAFINIPNNANAELGDALTINSFDSNSSVQIRTDWADPWVFGANGTTTFPTGLSIESLAPYYEGGMFEPPEGTVIRQATTDTELYIHTTGANARTVIGWLENPLNSELDGNVAEIQFNNYIGEVRISTGQYGNQVNGWQFLADGNLVLPPSSYILNSDDSIYSTTGNIVFTGPVIGLDEGTEDAADTYINISPSPEGWAFLQLPNDTSANTINTRLWNGAGNVEIGSGDFSNNSTSYTWIFDATGVLTLPEAGGDGYSSIQSTYNIEFSANGKNWNFATDGNLTLPTNGNINYANGRSILSGLGGGGAANTGNVQFDGNTLSVINENEFSLGFLNLQNNANEVVLGSDTAAPVKIGIYEDGNFNEWTFDSNGSLTLPGNIQSTSGTGPVTITSNDGANNRTWTFGTAGNLILPGKLWAKASDSGSIAFTNNGVDEHGYLKVDAGYNMIVNAESNFSLKRNGTDRIAITDTASDFKAVTDVRLVSNLAGSNKTWNFAASGIATLPSNSYLETTDANLKIGSQGTVTIRANAATVESTQAWTFGTNGATTFPGNISVPGNLSTIAGFTFYNGDPITIVATSVILSIRFIDPYYIEIAKTGLPAGFDTLLGSGAWTATAGGLTLTVVSVVSNGDSWRITVAENPNGSISSIATFNRAASGANIVIPAGGNVVTSSGSMYSIRLAQLKSIVASSATWGEFQANIAAL